MLKGLFDYYPKTFLNILNYEIEIMTEENTIC